jgi:hypothetical protein
MSIHTGGNGHEPHYDLPEPHPDLSPEDVVRTVLNALQHNDRPGPDFGVRTAFNFASPGNRSATGPLARFAEMIKSPGYGILIDFKTAQVDPPTTTGDHARVVVHITGGDGRTATFIWELTRQSSSPYRGCWMTDSVMPVE